MPRAYVFNPANNRYYRVPAPGDGPLPFSVTATDDGPRSDAEITGNGRASPSKPYSLRPYYFLRNLETQPRPSTHAEHLVVSILSLPSISMNSRRFEPWPDQMEGHLHEDAEFASVWTSVRGSHCYTTHPQKLFADADFQPCDRTHTGSMCVIRRRKIYVWNPSSRASETVQLPIPSCEAIAICGELSTRSNRANLNQIFVAAVLARASTPRPLFVVQLEGSRGTLQINLSTGGRNRSRDVAIYTLRWIAPPAADADCKVSSTALLMAGLRSGNILVWDRRAAARPVYGLNDDAFGRGGMVSDIRSDGNMVYVSRCSTRGSRSTPLLGAWDFRMPREHLLTFGGHVNEYRAYEFDVWNGVLVSGGDDKAVRLWDAKQGGRALAELPMSEPMHRCKLGDVDCKGRFVGGLRLCGQFSHVFYSIPGTRRTS